MRYKLDEKPVGEGGFGKVYKAEDTELERLVAIKSLDEVWRNGGPAERERFRREAKILASLAHPSIPAIYDVVLSDDAFQIIFQYVEGKTVRNLLKGGPLSIIEVRAWFDQIAAALDHAHSRDLVHRDVKPENMIVTSDRKYCYLVDFGIALSRADITRLTESNQRLGTPGYMSPEQERGEMLDAGDDLYVLAKCLYESLCGESIAAGNYVELSVLNETVPSGIDTLIQRCLEPKPNRLRSAAEFRRALASTYEVDRPFSEVLTDGHLREVIQAVANLSSANFANLPSGQRRLIVSKCKDVLQSSEEHLDVARQEFLVAMVPHIANVRDSDCEIIVSAGLDYGFERELRHWTGHRRIREALELAAMSTRGDSHSVMVQTLNEWITRRDLAGRQDWFLHSLRELVQRLMANPECDERNADTLGEHLDRINRTQRGNASQLGFAQTEQQVEIIHRRPRP